MAHRREHAGRRAVRWGAFLAAVLAFCCPAHAQGPRVGDVQRLKVISIALQVGSTEKETREVTYSPPPGWYVRSHWVDCTARRGNSSYSVNTVPQDWNWLSEEQVQQSYKALLDLAARVHDFGLQSRLALEQEALLRSLRHVRSTHHALVVDATARGEGFLRGGGCIELTVTAEIVYLGTDEYLRQTAAAHRARLGR